MANLTIRQYVELHLGETVRILQREVPNPSDGQEGRPEMVGAQITVALVAVLGSSATESALSDFARNYVGMAAARRLIPFAIDYHLERTGLSDKVTSPSRGAQLSVGETRQHYDRVKALQELDQMLADQMLADYPTFVDDTSDDGTPTRSAAPSITSMGKRPRTQNPREFDRVYRDRSCAAYGPWTGV